MNIIKKILFVMIILMVQPFLLSIKNDIDLFDRYLEKKEKTIEKDFHNIEKKIEQKEEEEEEEEKKTELNDQEMHHHKETTAQNTEKKNDQSDEIEIGDPEHIPVTGANKYKGYSGSFDSIHNTLILNSKTNSNIIKFKNIKTQSGYINPSSYPLTYNSMPLIATSLDENISSTTLYYGKITS